MFVKRKKIWKEPFFLLLGGMFFDIKTSMQLHSNIYATNKIYLVLKLQKCYLNKFFFI